MEGSWSFCHSKMHRACLRVLSCHLVWFHRASSQELTSAPELICSLSGPHSLLSKNACFMTAEPFSRLQRKIPETRTYLLQSRRLATVCSCMENIGGRPVKARVRHGAGDGSSDGAAILCGLFLSSQPCPSNPEGGGHQKGSDASREPCPSLMWVNSRQTGSTAAGPPPRRPPAPRPHCNPQGQPEL